MTLPSITVTKPALPDLAEFLPYLERIWENRWLTNNGPFHQQLERELARYLDVPQLALFVNGTIALLTALQTLRVTGEVITTPYSFVATAHSLLWNNIRPVFVDIEARSMNIDPDRIEAAITSQTTAILPVHCYGNPCDVEAIQRIADTYGLKVIYDAAHAFGVHYKGRSLMQHGDLSVLSFHATKVYHTFEGGAIVCADAQEKQRIDRLKNFGFADEVTVIAPGINGKLNELQSAFGVLQLKHVESAIAKREAVACRYVAALSDIDGITLPQKVPESTSNHGYFPIRVDTRYPISRDALYEKMREAGVFARRYFYPLISDMPMYRGLPSSAPSNLAVARRTAEQIICLPIYPDLSEQDQQKVISVIKPAGS